MKPADALSELINRVVAVRGQPLLVSTEELAQWPPEVVEALKSQELLSKAAPAVTTVCPGCEQECVMPVHALPGTPQSAPSPFIVCDKRDDVNRVTVPLTRLEQSRISGGAIANFLSRGLGLTNPSSDSLSTARWEVGLLKGRKHAGHLVLVADGGLNLMVSGHSVALAEVISMDGERLVLDSHRLRRLVDQPVAGSGDAESANSGSRGSAIEWRRSRHEARGCS